jgi:hypothetical protein
MTRLAEVMTEDHSGFDALTDPRGGRSDSDGPCRAVRRVSLGCSKE